MTKLANGILIRLNALVERGMPVMGQNEFRRLNGEGGITRTG